MCNKVYGSFTKSLLPYLTAIHIAPRPIWLVRAGLPAGQHEDDAEERHNPCAENKVCTPHKPKHDDTILLLYRIPASGESLQGT